MRSVVSLAAFSLVTLLVLRDMGPSSRDLSHAGSAHCFYARATCCWFHEKCCLVVRLSPENDLLAPSLFMRVPANVVRFPFFTRVDVSLMTCYPILAAKSFCFARMVIFTSLKDF